MTTDSANLQTIPALLSLAPADAIAIQGIDGEKLSYRQLRQRIDFMHRTFFTCGLRKTDVVVTSMPNSPETAITLLSLLTFCRAAPLNPAYTLHEVVSAVTSLGARTMVAPVTQSNAHEAAKQLGLRVLQPYELSANGQTFGQTFQPEFAPEPGDMALLLHTSGTTAQPKLVPLTQRNLWMSAQAISETLQLTGTDLCLSIMPLFHIHGIVAGLLASIAAGACVIATPGFQAMSFFPWLQVSRATWYTAVPTMHQAILARARHNHHAIESHSLRLIRSSSSPLYPAVWEQLEQTFRVPVLNSYGMTESAHQIASVRLDNALGRRSGVGQSSGLAIAILSTAGEMLPSGSSGEVALRGEQIMNGYLQPPEANDTAFRNGWFLTGDQGVLDQDGILTLTGRLKEIINSGGEKISPYEVEEALLSHPAVAQAVAFSSPHPMLGEQVLAAVVSVSGLAVTERDLLAAIKQRLAPCKCPKQIFFVDELPRGATGKLQRQGLAKSMGVGGS